MNLQLGCHHLDSDPISRPLLQSIKKMRSALVEVKKLQIFAKELDLDYDAYLEVHSLRFTVI